MQTEKQKIWKYHLAGWSTREIADNVGKSVRRVQIDLKDMRDKYPAAIENRAVNKFIKDLTQYGISAKVIRKRVRIVFNRTISLAAIVKIGAKGDSSCKKTCKKAGKKPTANALIRKAAQRGLHKAPQPVQSLCVAHQDYKKSVKKAVKRLAKQTGKHTKKKSKGTTKYAVVPQQVFNDVIRNITMDGIPLEIAENWMDDLKPYVKPQKTA